jgi:hypothetical protein
MEGFVVLTSDDEKVGHVVGEQGDNLIVEHGTIRKTRHPLPRAFAHVDEGERIVRTTISKEILQSAPRCDEHGVDEQAVALHYGLAEADPAPATEGYGELAPGDPGRSADEDAQRLGVPTADEERAAALQNQEPGQGAADKGYSPGVLGGDRFRDAP